MENLFTFPCKACSINAWNRWALASGKGLWVALWAFWGDTRLCVTRTSFCFCGDFCFYFFLGLLDPFGYFFCCSVRVWQIQQRNNGDHSLWEHVSFFQLFDGVRGLPLLSFSCIKTWGSFLGMETLTLQKFFKGQLLWCSLGYFRGLDPPPFTSQKAIRGRAVSRNPKLLKLLGINFTHITSTSNCSLLYPLYHQKLFE